jgi:hypothetical protein
MKVRLAVLAALVSASANAANPVSQPLGSTTTLGSTTNVWSLSSANVNPASSYLLVGKDDKTRFGILTAISGGYELGDVNDLQDKLEDLDEKLDNIGENLNEALELQEDFNDLLDEIGSNATFKGMLGGTVPLLPFIYKTDNYGAFTFSADLTTSAMGRVLTDQAKIVLNPLAQEFQLSTATSVYVKNMADVKFSIGYSNELFTWKNGSFVVGARANIHELTLGKSVLALSAMTNDEVGDAITGEIEDNQLTTSATSFDVGFIWTSKNYQIGVSVANVNEPSFDYKALGTDCLNITDVEDIEIARTNCFAAREFAGRGEIALEETHVMAQQATVEMALFSEDRSWNVSGSYDTNAVNDALGDMYQWSSIAAQIHPDWVLISGLRAGYKKNNVGSELSYASLGATFLKGINFDVSYGLENIDGDIPRSVYFSLGIETSF